MHWFPNSGLKKNIDGYMINTLNCDKWRLFNYSQDGVSRKKT